MKRLFKNFLEKNQIKGSFAWNVKTKNLDEFFENTAPERWVEEAFNWAEAAEGSGEFWSEVNHRWKEEMGSYRWYYVSKLNRALNK